MDVRVYRRKRRIKKGVGATKVFVECKAEMFGCLSKGKRFVFATGIRESSSRWVFTNRVGEN